MAAAVGADCLLFMLLHFVGLSDVYPCSSCSSADVGVFVHRLVHLPPVLYQQSSACLVLCLCTFLNIEHGAAIPPELRGKVLSFFSFVCVCVCGGVV